MVRLRGMPRPGPPGRGMGRPMPPHMRPEPIMPPFGMPRGRLIRGHPVRPGPPRLLPPRMPPPPPPRLGLPPPLPPRRLPLPPHPPHAPRDLPPPMGRRPLPPPPLARRPGMPLPPIPPMPPHLRRPMRPGPLFVRGRGGVARRGVKRLGGTTNGRAKKSQKRKEKTEGDFYCEACDRGFKSQELLDTHIAEHEVCGRDGCAFAAHPKIVVKHVQLQHESGLYHRIVFTQNPDEVAKWIAERKSRYPTEENIKKREAQTSEMIQRGERIPKQGKLFHSKDNWRDKRKRRYENSTNFDRNQAKRTKPDFDKINAETKWKDSEAWRGDLPKFPGTAAFPAIKDEPDVEKDKCECFSDEDIEVNSAPVIENVKKPLHVSNVLASLMMNYGSDTDGDSDTGSQSPNTSMLSLQNTRPKNGEHNTSVPLQETTGLSVESDLTKQEDKEGCDSAPEECGIERKDTTDEPVPKPYEDDSKPLVQIKPDVVEASRPKPPVRPPMKRYQLSLLEKLLQNEIRHERNAILQCVRYVVRNNFFG